MEEEVDARQRVLQSTLEEVNKSANNVTEDHDDPCVICLEAVHERAVASPCRHFSFDFLCLVSWLQERPNCPLCKSEVKSVEYEWRSPEDFKTYKVSPDGGQASSASASNRHDLVGFRARGGRHRSGCRPRRGLRSAPPPGPDATLLRRRHIYRNQLYSLHVGSNRLSRFRDLTPQLFIHDEELVSRARKWIRRELQVFQFLSPDGHEEEGMTRRANNAEFLLEYIIAILKTVDIKGSGGQAEDMLQEFLGRDNTRLFLHELKAWLRSPYTSLEDWDRNVQYNDALSRHSCEEHEPDEVGAHRDGDKAERRLSGAVARRGHSNFRGDRYRPYNRRAAAAWKGHYAPD